MKMTRLERAKMVDTWSYLSRYGINHADRMICAFWRGDKNPSVKVYPDGHWYDFGAGIGGDVIELAKTIEGCSTSAAIDILLDGTFSSLKPASVTSQPTAQTSDIEVVKVGPLWSFALKNYIRSRGISLEVAQRYTSEVRHRSRKTGREYYSVGFRNDRGGWALRNPCAGGKTCISPSGVTTIRGTQNTVVIVEGFFDLLSLVELYGRPKGDAVVLNSTSNIRQIEPTLGGYEKVFLLLDADAEGDRRTADLINRFGNTIDRRELLNEAKDLNEKLMNQKLTNN